MPTRAATAAYLAAVAAGVLWMHLSGAPATYALVNAVAGLLGVVLALVLRGRRGSRLETVALWLAPVAMALSLAIGPEVDGVHRWIAAGPLRLHAAALFGPAMLVALVRRADWHGAA